jgi:hypothetical protein
MRRSTSLRLPLCSSVTDVLGALTEQFREFLPPTPLAQIAISCLDETIPAKPYPTTTFVAFGGLVGRPLHQFLKVVLVCPVPNVQLGLKRLPAVGAIFPVSVVTLLEVVTTKSVATMVPVTTVPSE